MLNEPMMEKLFAMRLTGMSEALKAQEQDPAAAELSFHERLAMLVDQQWRRENQALGRRLKTAKLRGNACMEEIDYRVPRGLDKSVIRALTQESAWVAKHENIFVLGPTGVGKSFLASALCPESVSRQLLGVLRQSTIAVPRSRTGAGGRQPAASVGQVRTNRCDGDRRLGDGAAGGSRTPRLLGDLRRAVSDPLHDPDFSTADQPVARADRRSHIGRRHSRPVGS